MNYPQEFIDKCKSAYPDWPGLHKYLKDGSVIVGRMLDDGRRSRIKPEDVLAAKSLAPIRTEALRILVKEEVYQDWLYLYRATSSKRQVAPNE